MKVCVKVCLQECMCESVCNRVYAKVPVLMKVIEVSEQPSLCHIFGDGVLLVSIDFLIDLKIHNLEQGLNTQFPLKKKLSKY